VEFGNRNRSGVCIYQADVYSFDMDKFQYSFTAASALEAYDLAIEEALGSISSIRCIALYTAGYGNKIEDRDLLKVWQQLDPILGELKEY